MKAPKTAMILRSLLSVLVVLLVANQSAAQSATPAPASASSASSPWSPPPGSFNRFVAAYKGVESRKVLATTQDELIWYFGIVAEDIMARSAARWNQGGEAMTNEIQKILCSGRDDCSQIQQDIAAMQEFGRRRGNTNVDVELPVNRVMVAILEWLQAHPQPIPLFKKFPLP